MNLRNIDGSEVQKISDGSHKKILFDCDVCNISVEQSYRNYLNQKDGKFCRKCRNKHTANRSDVKEKQSSVTKERWLDDEYRKKTSNSLSIACKRSWEKRKTIVPERTKNVIETCLDQLGITFSIDNNIITIENKKTKILYCNLFDNSFTHVGKKFHLDKLNECQRHGYKLLTIFEDEWLYKKDIVKSRLKHILLPEKDLYARKCVICDISSSVAKEFVNTYHIQGYVSCFIKLGAFYESQLVSVMTFAKGNIAKGNKTVDNVFELSRFCLSRPVVGIAGKLMKYFETNYKPNEVFTYADRRWSEANVYNKMGFEFVSLTNPNYFYFNESKKRMHRYNFRKNVIKHHDTTGLLTEWEIMRDILKMDKIYDCGNYKLQKVYNII